MQIDEMEQLEDMAEKIRLELDEADSCDFIGAGDLIKSVSKQEGKNAIKEIDNYVKKNSRIIDKKENGKKIQKDIDLDSSDTDEEGGSTTKKVIEEVPLEKNKRKSTEEVNSNEIKKQKKSIEIERDDYFFCSRKEETKTKFKAYLSNLLYSSKMEKQKWENFLTENYSKITDPKDMNQLIMNTMLKASKSSSKLRSKVAACLAEIYQKTGTVKEKQINANVLNILLQTTTAISCEVKPMTTSSTCTISKDPLTKTNAHSILIKLKKTEEKVSLDHLVVTSPKWVDFFKKWCLFCAIDDVVLKKAKNKIGEVELNSKVISEFLKNNEEIDSLLEYYKTPLCLIYDMFDEKQKARLDSMFGPFWFRKE